MHLIRGVHFFLAVMAKSELSTIFATMNQTFLSFLCLLFGLATVSACSSEPVSSKQTSTVEQPKDTLLTLVQLPNLKGDTTIFILFEKQKIEVSIKMPKDVPFIGSILALPGWNFPNTGWCDSTTLCEKALKQGYAVILPEMGKSIYCDSVFPETRKDWLIYPTRAWMKQTMIPHIQSTFQLLVEDQNNFVMGLSTGARGAVLLAMDLPEIFSACGALSGDYDQTRYTKDKLYNGYYGGFDMFKQRWLENDNAITSIKQISIPIYVAHGQKDKIVPIDYSQQLFVALQESGNEASILNINPTAGHTYTYWNSEVDAVLAFFNKYSK